MAQFGRPSADISVGGWGATPLWSKLNEVTPDDSTSEITSGNNPSNVTCEVRVTGISDPEVNTGHVVRARVKKSANAGRTINFTFTLLQGTTTIATWSGLNVTGTYATFTHNLTEGEAGNITNYSDLRVRVVANNPDTGPGRSAEATWIEMEAPDAPPQEPVSASFAVGFESLVPAAREIALLIETLSDPDPVSANFGVSFETLVSVVPEVVLWVETLGSELPPQSQSRLRYILPAVLDGDPVPVGDGIPSIRSLVIPVGAYAIPLWLVYDVGIPDRVDALPFRTVKRFGSIQVLSSPPE